MKRYEEALVALDRAVTLDPDFADAWFNTGLALRHLERHQEALTALERACSLDPHKCKSLG